MNGAHRLVLTLALAACRPGGAPPIPSPGDPCIIAGHSARPDSVVIGVTGGVDTGYALWQRTRAESVIVAHVYETLVRVTCDQRIVPGLAEHWTTQDAGRSWSFSLRADATFSDGTAVTGMSVADAWRERRHASGAPADERAAAIEGVTLEPERRITVRFRDAQRHGPRILADPYYAVHRAVSPSEPPIGSGAWLAPRSADPNASRGALAMIRLAPRTPGVPALVLAAPRTGDERDLIDAGIDVMTSFDPRILEYAATRSDLGVTRLPPDHAYILITADRARLDTPAQTASNDPRWDALRASLARDIVRSPPGDGAWWGSSDRLTECAGVPSTGVARWPARASSARTRRIVYPVSDRLAGDLARRLVAIAAQPRESSLRSLLDELVPALTEPSGVPLVAAGLEPGALLASLAQGDDPGYVLALPPRALDPCASWREFAMRAPWIAPGTPVVIGKAGPSLLSGANAPDVMFDWDNMIRIVPHGPAPGAPR